MKRFISTLSQTRRSLINMVACACLSFLFGTYSEVAQANETLQAEYQIKALFLYNFANFVEWPSNAFNTPTDSIKMCLYGDVPFGGFLDAVDGTPVGRRRLYVFRTDKLDEIKAGCHVLFVGDDKKVRLPTFWQEIQYIYVLSIGEQEGFTDRGGIVNIMRTTDQVLFEINITNAMANGLFISSDVLSLAREVKRNKEQSDEAN